MKKPMSSVRYSIAVVLLLLVVCGGFAIAQSINKNKVMEKTTTQVRISTNYGDIVVRLYDENPQYHFACPLRTAVASDGMHKLYVKTIFKNK